MGNYSGLKLFLLYLVIIVLLGFFDVENVWFVSVNKKPNSPISRGIRLLCLELQHFPQSNLNIDNFQNHRAMIAASNLAIDSRIEDRRGKSRRGEEIIDSPADVSFPYTRHIGPP